MMDDAPITPPTLSVPVPLPSTSTRMADAPVNRPKVKGGVDGVTIAMIGASDLTHSDTSEGVGGGSSARRRRRRRISPQRWLYGWLLPHLRATLTQRGFISLYQLAHALLIIGDHEHLCAALINALDHDDTRVTRSIARTHKLDGLIDRVEHVFAPLLNRPPYPRDVLRYLRVDHLALSDGTIAFITAAFEKHCLTGAAERVFIERLANARVPGQSYSARRVDPAAWQALFDNNLWLVCHVARTHAGHGLEFDDLIQEGSLALVTGLEKCDMTRINNDAGLGYYLWIWIGQRVRRAIADTRSVVRIPVHASEAIAEVGAKAAQLTQELGRYPTRYECAARLDMTPDAVRRALIYAQDALSFDTIGADQREAFFARDRYGTPFHDALAMTVDERALRRAVEDAFRVLRQRERAILALRFGLYDEKPRTLEEVGVVLGVSRGRIHEIEKRALKKLRHPRHHLIRLRDWY